MAWNEKMKRLRFTYNGERYAVYGHTQTELAQKAAEKKRELETLRRQGKDKSVMAWRDEWLDLYKKGKVAPGTFSSYKAVLSHLDLTMPVRDVRPSHLQKIVNGLTGKSNSLIHKFCVLVKELFEAAVDEGLCITNPAKKLTPAKGTTHARRPLTTPERRLIEKVAPSSDAGPYVALMLYAGCRPGEAGIVQGKDVNIEEGTLHVRGTKTAAADRYVPISEKLMPYLVGLKQNEFAVKDYYGNPTTPQARKGLWKRFMRELNLAAGAKVGRPNKNTPHDIPLEELLAADLQPYLLRHTFCTDLEAAGVPINVARDLMGHSSITITSKIYTHRSDAALQDAARKINAYNPDLHLVAAKK